MTAMKWAVVAMLVLGSVSNILNIDKPRKPVSGPQTAVVVAINFLLMAAVLAWWPTSCT